MGISSLLIYLLFDSDKKMIEDKLKCKVSRSSYHSDFIDYKIVGSLDDSNVKELEDTIKRKVSVIYKNFSYKVRVYGFYLSKKCDFEFVQTKDLVLGMSYDGLLTIPLHEEINNYLIVGASGSGKSSLARSIIANLKHNDVEVWISDNKGSHDYDFLQLPMTKNVQDFISMLERFEELVEQRLSENKKHEPLLYVIDEVFPIACLDSKTRSRVFNKLALILSRCRSANCHVMIISQRSTTDIIDPRLLANISNRICLSTSSKQESVNVLGSDIAFRIDTIGRGILSVNGHMTEFQSFYMKAPKNAKKTKSETVKIESKTIIGSERSWH